MNTILNCDLINEKEYKFTITFENNENFPIILPVGKLQNSAENVGLIFEINDKQLEPVSYKTVSKKEYKNVELKPGEKISIEQIASIENLGKSYWGLVFKTATYEIKSGEKYKIWFSLNGFVSKPIEIIFDLDK